MEETNENAVDAAVIETALTTPSTDATAQVMLKLESEFKGIIIDVSTPTGEAFARMKRRQLVSLRSMGDKMRKDLNKPMADTISNRNDAWKKISAQIEEYELPIDNQIKEKEKQIEEEKKRKAEEARIRLQQIMENIEKIKGIPARAIGKTSAELDEVIAFLNQKETTEESYGEFVPLALEALKDTKDELNRMREQKISEEEQAAQTEKERLDQLEKERLQREEDERKLAEEREQLRLRQVELDKQAEALRVQIEEQNRKEAEARKEQEEKDRLDQIEKDRLMKEEQEKQRLAQEEENKRQIAIAAEAEKKRKEEEKARKAAEKAKKLADAKFSTLRDALQAIQDICADASVNDADARSKIAIIAEANIG